tara:strand:- start:399 stop:902 length:504 start_codon:yes stop_codon:yes gene_type:complete
MRFLLIFTLTIFTISGAYAETEHEKAYDALVAQTMKHSKDIVEAVRGMVEKKAMITATGLNSVALAEGQQAGAKTQIKPIKPSDLVPLSVELFDKHKHLIRADLKASAEEIKPRIIAYMENHSPEETKKYFEEALVMNFQQRFQEGKFMTTYDNDFIKVLTELQKQQ